MTNIDIQKRLAHWAETKARLQRELDQLSSELIQAIDDADAGDMSWAYVDGLARQKDDLLQVLGEVERNPPADDL